MYQLPRIYEEIVRTKLLKYFDNIDEIMENQARFSPKKRQQQQSLLAVLTTTGGVCKDDNVSIISRYNSNMILDNYYITYVLNNFYF